MNLLEVDVRTGPAGRPSRRTGQALLTPARSYLICCLQRSGSWLLADTLKATGVAGVPEEYYWHEFHQDYLGRWGNPELADYDEFMAWTYRMGTTPNGVFAAKLHWGELCDLVESLRTLPHNADLEPSALVQRYFPDCQIVYLRREDKVRQAISWFRAAATTSWYEVEGERRHTTADLQPDWTRIHRMEMLLREHEASWLDFFDHNRLPYLEIVYEDLEDRLEPTVEAVLRHLDLRPSGFTCPPPRLRRQRDQVTEEWVQQYLSLRRSWDLAARDVYPARWAWSARSGSGGAATRG